MYKGKKPRWRTKEGKLLRLRDMSDAHLVNARQAVVDGKVALRHTCWSVGGQEGPCADCDAARSWKDNWLDRFDREIAKRPMTPAQKRAKKRLKASVPLVEDIPEGYSLFDQ